MFYQPDFVQFIMNGGLGDVIMALPVLRYAICNDFGDQFRVSCPPEYDFLVKDWINSKYIHNFFNKVVWPGRVSMMRVTKDHSMTPRTNITLYASMNMLGKLIPVEHRSLPRWQSLNLFYENDMQAWMGLEKSLEGVDLSKSVILPVSFRSHAKKWNQKCLIEFVEYLKSQNLTPICVGGSVAKDSKLIAPNFLTKSISFPEGAVDLVGRISVKQTLALMQRSLAVVGVTGGLIQLAGLTDRPIVCLSTYTDLFHSLFWRDGEFAKGVYPVVPPENKCAFCVNDFIVNYLDYNECLLGKNFECTEFEFSQVKAAFEKVASGKPCDLQISLNQSIIRDFG